MKTTNVFIRGQLKSGGEVFTYVPFKWYGKYPNGRVFQPIKPVFELLNRIMKSWEIDDPYLESKGMV